MSLDARSLSTAERASNGDRTLALSGIDSTQIDLLRAVCIFLMLSVHVYPTLLESTIIHGGEWDWVGYVYVDIFGRASVAVLSFLGGYVLWVGARHRPLSEIARSRFRSLIIPMMTWNLIYAAMVAAVALMERRDLAAEMARYGVDTPIGAVTAITGVAGRTINVPLTFLRDLFVSILAARLLFPAMPRFGVQILTVLLALALIDISKPIFVTPAIPLFVFAGAFFAAKGLSLKSISDTRVALPASIILACLFVASHLLPTMRSSLDEEAVNLSERAMLVAMMLLVSRIVAERIGARDLAGVRPVLFLAFLTHSIINQFLGILWEMFGLGVYSVLYIAFFFLNAPLDITAAWIGMLLIRQIPRRLQLVLNGSAGGEASATRS